MIAENKFIQHLGWMEKAPYLVVDTEGTLNHPFSETWGLSTSYQGYGDYFPFRHKYGQNLPTEWLVKLAGVIQNHKCLIFHNAKHDLKALRNFSIDYKGKFYDTMLMAHWINENLVSKELDWLSKHYDGPGKSLDPAMELIKKKLGWSWIPAEQMHRYGQQDAVITEHIFNAMLPEFTSQGFDGELWDIEQKFVRLMGKIEDQGILIDQDLASREYERGIKIMSELTNELGFNPGSGNDLAEFFLEDLQLPVFKLTKNGNPSFDKEAMEQYEEVLARTKDPRATQVLAYRGWQKTTSSNYKAYLDLVHPDGRLRPNYKIHGTRTGRLSCEKPNLQQIPRSSSKDWNGALKPVFIVEQGRRGWDFDYSQLELRLGAAYGGPDPKLAEILSDSTRDVFNEMAAQLGMSRQDTKTLNYTIQFGGGVERLKHVFGFTSAEAKRRRNNYYTTYSGLNKASRLASLRCQQNGYVKYWSGRRRHFARPDKEGHKAFNALCQGGGFEIVKRALIEIDDAGLNNKECALDLQVHDSGRFDIEEGKEHIYHPEIKHIMETSMPDFGIPFKVEIKEWAS